MEGCKESFEKKEKYKYSVVLDSEFLERICNDLNPQIFNIINISVSCINGRKITYQNCSIALNELDKLYEKIETLQIRFQQREEGLYYPKNEIVIEFTNNIDSYFESIIIEWKLSDFKLYSDLNPILIKNLRANKAMYSQFNLIPLSILLSGVIVILCCLLLPQIFTNSGVLLLAIALITVVMMLVSMSNTLLRFSLNFLPKIQFLFGNNIKSEKRKSKIREIVFITIFLGILVSLAAGWILNKTNGG